MLLFGECEETETKQTLASNKELHLPKLFVPFKDKSRGWQIGTVREQAILYLNCLGYGHGGKSLADTKSKKAEKLDCFSPKLDFGQYEHPSKASLQSNEFLIALCVKPLRNLGIQGFAKMNPSAPIFPTQNYFR